MNWIQEVEKRIRQKNQIYFAKDSLFLQDLKDLLESQDHRVLVLWALDLAQESVQAWECKHPQETRPRQAFQAAQDWSMGKIKMRGYNMQWYQFLLEKPPAQQLMAQFVQRHGFRNR